VVGLGNPGPEYDGTRHNLGADAVRVLAARRNLGMRRGRERAAVAETRVDGALVALAVPETYMNLSGESVARLVRRYRVEGDGDRVVVVHDEMDLPVGRVKVKLGGGVAGHNGLDSIRSHLHTPGFVRVRIGIARPPTSAMAASYVLRRPPARERVELEVAVEQAADAVELILADGVEAAMNRFNTAPPG